MADDSTKVEGADLPKDVLAPAEGPRENLVVTAVKFLQNPKVWQSPLSQKKAFLDSKGLTPDEIQLAIQRAGVTDDASSPQSALQPQPPLQHPAVYPNTALVPAPPPPPPLSPWTKAREIATTTAVIAAVSYAVYNVFKVYIRPWLVGQSESETRLQRLETNIAQLQASVAESNAQMVESLKAIQESMIAEREKSIQSTEVGSRQDSHALSEIKSEISSLKGLLLNRRQFPPPPITSPIVPAWQKSALREDQSQVSPAKSDGVGDPSATDSGQNLATETDLGQEKDKEQPLDTSAMATGGPVDSLQASQSATDASVSQSNSSSNNGFEMVKPSADPEAAAAAELD